MTRSMTAQVLQALVARHQEARSKVTPEVMEQFVGIWPMKDLFADLTIASKTPA